MAGYGERRTPTPSTMDDTVYNFSVSMRRSKALCGQLKPFSAIERCCFKEGKIHKHASLSEEQDRNNAALDEDRHAVPLPSLLEELRGLKLLREALREELLHLGRTGPASRMGQPPLERAPDVASVNDSLEQARVAAPVPGISWVIPSNLATGKGKSQRLPSLRRTRMNFDMARHEGSGYVPGRNSASRETASTHSDVPYLRDGSYTRIQQKQKLREEARRVPCSILHGKKKRTAPPSRIPCAPRRTDGITKRIAAQRSSKIPRAPSRCLNSSRGRNKAVDASCFLTLQRPKTRKESRGGSLRQRDNEAAETAEMHELVREIAGIDRRLEDVTYRSRSRLRLRPSAAKRPLNAPQAHRELPSSCQLPSISKARSRAIASFRKKQSRASWSRQMGAVESMHPQNWL